MPAAQTSTSQVTTTRTGNTVTRDATHTGPNGGTVNTQATTVREAQPGSGTKTTTTATTTATAPNGATATSHTTSVSEKNPQTGTASRTTTTTRTHTVAANGHHPAHHKHSNTAEQNSNNSGNNVEQH